MEPDTAEGIAAYPRFRAAAAEITETSFPEVLELDDGGIAAIRLDAVLPPTVRPYDEVAERVAEAARLGALRAALQDRLTAIEAEVAGGAALGNFGIVSVSQAMPRGARVDGAPADLMNTVFAMAPGETRRIVAGDFAALLRLDAVQAADHAAPEAAILKSAVVAQFGQQMGQDAWALFSAALEQGVQIRLDEGVIAAVQSQMR